MTQVLLFVTWISYLLPLNIKAYVDWTMSTVGNRLESNRFYRSIHHSVSKLHNPGFLFSVGEAEIPGCTVLTTVRSDAMYRLTLHFLRATKTNFDDVSASAELNKGKCCFLFFHVFFSMPLHLRKEAGFEFSCRLQTGSPLCVFFSTSTLSSIQFTLPNTALSPQSWKTLYHHLN